MEDYQAVTYKFREIKNTLSAYLTQVLPAYQITPIIMYTLEFLRKHPECRAVDIANEFGLTRGAVTQLLDKMEQQGYVIRKPHPTSRRSLHIHITEKGYELLDVIIKTYNSKIERLLSNYSSEELATLRELLSKMSI
ncbi:MarR family winged helix-turn-helix transcriptional regulator [Paenibacillus radicis (ex Xue et al. 2023)]|uniref:MarR family transcriptional regulator n=1 Tax=Paenibacillus radicis (ex Xue et al. 2023) TaxID=2972489 RepID=A0ABT1YGG6_9BACL|nr:MarR family transcriptional regulator [Paenibacillus radicis (ex Xue et al. 2023)]MCR8631484.1 MarR family transcriptional regulator [Paenibacillus radicis (ex Xue et al. 2023)]